MSRNTERKADDETRHEALRRHRRLVACRDFLGLTNKELARELSRLSGDEVSYWTVRSWMAHRESGRARSVPNWALRLLKIAHPELPNVDG